MTIAESLKRFRKEFKVTQKQIADVLGIKQQSYAPYETKNVMPSAAVIVKLATAFNVSADYLLGLTNEPHSMVESSAPVDVDEQESNALTVAAENDRILDYHENLAHILAKQGITI